MKTTQSSSSSSSGSHSSSSRSRSSSSRSSSSRSSSSRSSGGRGSNSSQDSRSDRSSNRSNSSDPPKSIISVDDNHHFLDEMVGYGYGYRIFTRTFNRRRGRARRQRNSRSGQSFRFVFNNGIKMTSVDMYFPFSERHRRPPSQSLPPISAPERHPGSHQSISQRRRFDINSGINNLRISDTSD